MIAPGTSPRHGTLIEAHDALEDALKGSKVMANRLNHDTQRTPRLRCFRIQHQWRGTAGVDRWATNL